MGATDLLLIISTIIIYWKESDNEEKTTNAQILNWSHVDQDIFNVSLHSCYLLFKISGWKLIKSNPLIKLGIPFISSSDDSVEA